jgi:hypothetical protein
MNRQMQDKIGVLFENIEVIMSRNGQKTDRVLSLIDNPNLIRKNDQIKL